MIRKTRVNFTYSNASSHNPYKIWMSNQLVTYYGIEPNEKVWFRYGSERIQVLCMVKLDDSCMTVSLCKELTNEHSLPEPDSSYTMSYKPVLRELQIGPIIAVFSEKTELETNRFGNITDFSKELSLLCHEHLANFYIFSLDDVQTNHIQGYNFKDGILLQQVFPYPDVIYNRISKRSLERSDTCIDFFNNCQDRGILYFNDHFLSKLETFRILVEQNALAAYLPETHLLSDEKMFLELLQRHTSIFLKPIHGSEGRGILRILKTSEEKFRIEASMIIDPPLPDLTTEGVLSFIKQFVPIEDYIVQQGIPLVTHSGGIVDFRLLCNRNELGHWCVTSGTARVSASNPIVTNMSYGAHTFPLSEILHLHFDKTASFQIQSLLYELALETSESIHKAADGIFGELGIDFGVDVHGHPWILEVNTKPSKQYLTTSPPYGIRPSAKGVFLFANFLYSKFLQ